MPWEWGKVSFLSFYGIHRYGTRDGSNNCINLGSFVPHNLGEALSYILIFFTIWNTELINDYELEFGDRGNGINLVEVHLSESCPYEFWIVNCSKTLDMNSLGGRVKLISMKKTFEYSCPQEDSTSIDHIFSSWSAINIPKQGRQCGAKLFQIKQWLTLDPWYTFWTCFSY